MKVVLAISLMALAATPALAQEHHHDAPAPAPAPAAVAPSTPAEGEPRGTDQGAGSVAPPPMVHDRAADRFYDPAQMAKAEAAMMDGHAAPRYTVLKLDRAEWKSGDHGGAYRWEGEAWHGDVNRLWLRSRGEGEMRGSLDKAEVEAAYSRALDPWWNLQAGVRQDFGPGPQRSHAMIAVEGLAPYRFETLGALYLSDKGQVTARAEASFDQRITRRLVLQPRVEVNFALQDMPVQRLGAGVTGVEAGVRLRYEIKRGFAPYVGVNWESAVGRSADYARADGKDVRSSGVVLGIKAIL